MRKGFEDTQNSPPVFHDFTITVAPAARAAECPDDCNGDQRVTVEELRVNIMLERNELADCERLDTAANDRITVAELVTATRHALEGCAG